MLTGPGNCGNTPVYIREGGGSPNPVWETAFPTSSSAVPRVRMTSGIPWSYSEKCSPLFVLVAFCLQAACVSAYVDGRMYYLIHTKKGPIFQQVAAIQNFAELLAAGTGFFL